MNDIVVRPGGSPAVVIQPRRNDIHIDTPDGPPGPPGPPGPAGPQGQTNVISLTQTEFDALPTKDPQTLYIIIE